MTLSIAGDIAEPETEGYSTELPRWNPAEHRQVTRESARAFHEHTSTMRSTASALAMRSRSADSR